MLPPGPFGATTRGRLLPAGVPFRFFGLAAVFHIAGWSVLALWAEQIAGFRAGLGPPLAALHLMTLGVLATSVIGASLQMLPIATVQPIRSVGAAKTLWWMVAAGIAVLTGAMGARSPYFVLAGAVLSAAALVIYAWLFAWNLAGARRSRSLARFGWAGWCGLVITIVSGFLLAAQYVYGWLSDSSALVVAHAGFALVGFIGMLALGFSALLVPMFALARPPADRTQLFLLAGWLVAGGLFAAGELVGGTLPTRAFAAGLGFLLAAAHLVTMEAALARRLRKTRDPFLLQTRFAWGAMLAAFACALPLALKLDWAPRPSVFVAIAVLGWLATFVFAILQRIVPFLASVHAKPAGKAPPLPSALTPQMPLIVHGWAHCAGVTILVIGLAVDAAWLVRAGALLGLIGALAFGVFFAGAMHRMRTLANAAIAISPP